MAIHFRLSLSTHPLILQIVTMSDQPLYASLCIVLKHLPYGPPGIDIYY